MRGMCGRLARVQALEFLSFRNRSVLFLRIILVRRESCPLCISLTSFAVRQCPGGDIVTSSRNTVTTDILSNLTVSACISVPNNLKLLDVTEHPLTGTSQTINWRWTLSVDCSMLSGAGEKPSLLAGTRSAMGYSARETPGWTQNLVLLCTFRVVGTR